MYDMSKPGNIGLLLNDMYIVAKSQPLGNRIAFWEIQVLNRYLRSISVIEKPQWTDNPWLEEKMVTYSNMLTGTEKEIDNLLFAKVYALNKQWIKDREPLYDEYWAYLKRMYPKYCNPMLYEQRKRELLVGLDHLLKKELGHIFSQIYQPQAVSDPIPGVTQWSWEQKRNKFAELYQEFKEKYGVDVTPIVENWHQSLCSEAEKWERMQMLSLSELAKRQQQIISQLKTARSLEELKVRADALKYSSWWKTAWETTEVQQVYKSLVLVMSKKEEKPMPILPETIGVTEYYALSSEDRARYEMVAKSAWRLKGGIERLKHEVETVTCSQCGSTFKHHYDSTSLRAKTFYLIEPCPVCGGRIPGLAYQASSLELVTQAEWPKREEPLQPIPKIQTKQLTCPDCGSVVEISWDSNKMYPMAIGKCPVCDSGRIGIPSVGYEIKVLRRETRPAPGPVYTPEVTTVKCRQCGSYLKVTCPSPVPIHTMGSIYSCPVCGSNVSVKAGADCKVELIKRGESYPLNKEEPPPKPIIGPQPTPLQDEVAEIVKPAEITMEPIAPAVPEIPTPIPPIVTPSITTLEPVIPMAPTFLTAKEPTKDKWVWPLAIVGGVIGALSWSSIYKKKG